MNREHESPTDPMFEPEPPQASEWLDEIERRLKAARPRPPQLDVAALERLAGEAVVDTAVERPAAAAIRRRLPGRGRRPDRHMAAVAGSWACGAVVGALVTFILMGHTAPGTDSTNETTRLEKEAPTPATHDQNTVPDAGQKPDADQKMDRRDGPPPVEKVEALDVDDPVLAMILDRIEGADSAYWPEGPTLRAGMHLVQNAVDPSPVGRMTDAATKPRGVAERWRGEASKPYPDPGPAVTRKRLLHDLRSETPGFIL